MNKIDVWKKTIKKYFKNEKIISIKDYKNFHDVNCAIIWKLPDNILSRLKNLQVIFSMGAGVDHILKLKNYNKKIPIIRIKDEEMGERIANYSLAQILNYQLNFKIFQNSQNKHNWSGERTPIDNKENRIELGQNAKNRAENELIWEKQVVKYNKLIDDLQ